MFCGKCGREIPEGTVCPCQQETQEQTAQAAPAAKAGINLSLGTMVTLGVALLTFIFHFINWYSVDYFGGFGPFRGLTVSFMGISETASLWDITAMMGIAAILVWVNLFVFALMVAVQFVDFKKLIPALEPVLSKFDLKKLLPFVWYAIMLAALLFGFIGILIDEATGIGAGWILTLIFAAIGMVNILKPDLLDQLLSKFKK